MAIYIWNADFDVAKAGIIEQKLRAVIPDLIKVTRVEDALASVSRQSDARSHLLLIAPTRDKAHLAKLTDMASRYRDRIFIILIGDEISASEYKSLVRTGGADWIPASAEPQEVLDIIAGSRPRGRLEATSKAADPTKPIAISLVPSAGGVGNTTLAIEIGVHLKTNKPTRDRDICVVDLDFQSSHVCDYLDIEPRLQIREISSNPERLDAQLFDIFISRHSSGLHVFAAPRSKIDLCDLNVAALDMLFDMVAARYELILIDLPTTWFAWTPQIIDASDGIIVTGVNTIPGLRQAADTLVAVRDNARASSQIAIAVNRCQRRLLGGIARRDHVETVLGRENIFYVSNESMALESINTGIPMTMNNANRMINRDIAALATYCANLKSLRATPA